VVEIKLFTQDFFSKPAVQDIVADHQIWLLVFDPNTEEIVSIVLAF